MTEDTRPKVDFNDLTRAFYEEKPKGWILRLLFKKDGQTGSIRFGYFKTKDEVKSLMAELRKSSDCLQEKNCAIIPTAVE